MSMLRRTLSAATLTGLALVGLLLCPGAGHAQFSGTHFTYTKGSGTQLVTGISIGFTGGGQLFGIQGGGIQGGFGGGFQGGGFGGGFQGGGFGGGQFGGGFGGGQFGGGFGGKGFGFTGGWGQ